MVNHTERFSSIFESSIENSGIFDRWRLSKEGNLTQISKSDHSMGEARTTFSISFAL